MNFKTYKLEGKQILPIELHLWGEWFENFDRQLYFDVIGLENVEVSTVFLGIDHGYSCPPPLFETLITFGQFDGETFQATSFKEARRNHRQACRMVRTGRQPEPRPEYPMEDLTDG